MSGGMFWDGYELSATLGSLSSDGWGCVSVLLVVWPEAFQYRSLQHVGWGQVFVTRWGRSGELTPIHIC